MVDPTARMGAPPVTVNTSLSGLSDDEAKSFHRLFVTSFIAFTLIAAAAHYAVWQWRPWIPGVEGYPVTTTSAPALTPSATVVASTP